MNKIEIQNALENFISTTGLGAYLDLPDTVLAEYLIDVIEILKRTKNTWKLENEPDESMDGDHASALASAGYGTDEDYGAYSEIL